MKVIGVVLAICAAHAVAVAPADQVGKEYYWNVAGKGLDQWNTSHALGHNVHNDRVVLLTTWFGAYPELTPDEHTGRLKWCNGGIPQLANLTRHVALIKRDLAVYMKEIGLDLATFSGYFVNDYEAWKPAWAFTPAIYQNASLQWTKSRHVHLTGHALLDKAREEYETAAIAFLTTTLHHIQKHAPHAKGTGFYGYPHWTFWGNTSQYVLEDARWAPLWEATTAFYLSIYMNYMSGVDIALSRNLGYMQGMLHEADRLNDHMVAKGLPRRPVLPYTWYRYHPGEPHANQFLSDTDLCVEFDWPFTLMRNSSNTTRIVDGLIIWGSEESPAAAAATKKFLVDHAAYFGKSAPCKPPLDTPVEHDVAVRGAGSARHMGQWIPYEEAIPPYEPCSL